MARSCSSAPSRSRASRTGTSWRICPSRARTSRPSRSSATTWRRFRSGKASLVVAHTATVPPADIQVNGDVLFENIGNGEALELTVPVATYEVAIVPTGETEPVVLGPLELTVKGGAVNRVYAIGDPGKKTMNVAVHVIPTGSSGSGEPVRCQHRCRRRCPGSSSSELSEQYTARPRDASWRARSVPCCWPAGWPAAEPRPGRGSSHDPRRVLVRPRAPARQRRPGPVPSARVGKPGRTERVTLRARGAGPARQRPGAGPAGGHRRRTAPGAGERAARGLVGRQRRTPATRSAAPSSPGTSTPPPQ